jgi:enoyl-CoA hydratase/carnithine racemase
VWSAEQALAFGLVTKVFPTAELLQAGTQVALGVTGIC